MVSLPYEKDFNEKQIPTKARPIQMSPELLEYCKKEINDLLSKKLKRPSHSPWSCCDAPKIGVSFDNPSTHIIFVDVGYPETTHENWQSLLCTGSSTRNTTCLNHFPTTTPGPHASKMATWAHASILTKYISTIYQ